MGIVYKARQIGLKRLVALKVIRAGTRARQEELRRFRREAEVMARLQHPNIEQVYEVGEHDGHPFLSLEFIDGGSLAAKLAGTPQPSRQAAELVETLARAMEVAHQHGIIHRDLKPSNILLQTRGEPSGSLGIPKIADFGLAKHLDDDGEQTRSGAVLGTPRYMAPEQAEGRVRDVGPTSDVYALGAILYELLTGRPPFLGGSTLMTIALVLSVEPVPPRRLQPSVPQDLETICLKCLQKQPARRYSTALALAEDLRRFLSGEPIQARPVSSWERAHKWARRRPALAALALVSSLAALLLLTGGLLYQRELSAHNEQLEEAFTTIQQESAAARKAKTYAEEQRDEARKAKTEAEEQRDQAGKARKAARDEAERARQRERRTAYALQLAHVGEMWERDPARGLELLVDTDTCPADLRDFTWAYLYRLCDRVHPVFRGQTGRGIFGASCGPVFSPKDTGRQELAVGGMDGKIAFWDLALGRRIDTFKAHPKGVGAVVYSPDGKTLTSAGWDGIVRHWDPATGKEKASPLQAHKGPATALAYNKDGSLLASGGHDQTVKLWETATGKLKATLGGHTGPIWSLAFSPDGKQLAVGTLGRGPGEPTLWDVATEKVHLSLAVDAHARAVAFSLDGKLATTGSSRAKLWDPASGKELLDLEGYQAGAHTAAFSPDGRSLAVGYGNPSVKLWNLATGYERTSFHTSSFGVVHVAFAPDGKSLAARQQDGRVIVWRLPAGAEQTRLHGQTDEVWSVAFTSGDKYLVSGGRDGKIKVWDLATAQEREIPLDKKLPAWSVWSVAVSPDSKTLAVARGEMWKRGDLTLWEASTGRKLAALPGHEGMIWSVTFSSDGKTLASGSVDHTVKLWDAVTGRLRSTLRHTGPVHCVCFSPDGRLVAAAGLDGNVKIWDIALGTVKQTLPGPNGDATSLAFSADGDTLAVGYGRRNFDRLSGVILWDWRAQRKRKTLAGHAEGIFSICFSPDRRVLATASADGTVKLWDPATGHLRGTLRGHRGLVIALAFDSASRTLATGGADGTIRLWEAAPGK
jgi:WD40 repeat protein